MYPGDYRDVNGCRIVMSELHVLYLENHFKPDVISKIYVDVNFELNDGQSIPLWEDEFEGKYAEEESPEDGVPW